MRYTFRLLIFGISLALAAARAATPDPNDILVSVQLNNFNGGTVQNHVVREFTSAGSLVQIIPFPKSNPNPPGLPWLRDVAVDQFGGINAFDGTFNPYLERYSTSSNTFSHQNFPGWSILNDTTWGGLATFRNFVYVTDSYTFYGQPSGIIRFDLSTNQGSRFADGYDFGDLNIGADGKLYGLISNETSAGGIAIAVFDPITMLMVTQFSLPDDLVFTDSIRGLAADQNGKIFLVGQQGFVYRLNADGSLDASQSTGFFNLMDVDVDETGKIIIGQEEGYVLIGQTDLTTPFASFLTYDDPNVMVEAVWVAFAHSVPLPKGEVVPTPAPVPIPTPTPKPTHNILVSIGDLSGSGYNGVREFSFDGTLRKTIPFDYKGGAYPGTEYLRDIVVQPDGTIAGFNGTFSPLLTRYSAGRGLTNSTLTGWDTYNNTTYGGIAAFGKFVYVTDMNTAGETNLNGIVRFNTTANTAQRFAIGIDFTDLNMGLDGKLYGLYSVDGPGAIATDLNVYDPVTMEFIRQLSLPPDLVSEDDIRSVAVDKDGRIFACGLGGAVYRLNNNGFLEAAAATGFNVLSDIDVDDQGKLVIAAEDGWIVTGDSTLGDFSSFNAVSDYVDPYIASFVAFTAPVSTSPSPTPRPTKLPIMNIAVSPQQIHPGETATFIFSLSAPAVQPISFDWTSGGTAVGGVDFLINGVDPASLPHTVTLQTGETSALLVLQAVAGVIPRNKELVTIQIGARPEYRLKKKAAKVKIVNPR